ncbi:myocyte-specific enhancer factor [Anaeramoeba flamelloides]|uniref:Myocyte-specific enhancer factor n=1 Tax=Anaeramoeba flamelloides TaxID=1746091 RepID=A0AAV7Z537_9EUKA|nr:myocyte-specific enhancer factor [Anaeramoeba flamelloides]
MSDQTKTDNSIEYSSTKNKQQPLNSDNEIFPFNERENTKQTKKETKEKGKYNKEQINGFHMKKIYQQIERSFGLGYEQFILISKTKKKIRLCFEKEKFYYQKRNKKKKRINQLIRYFGNESTSCVFLFKKKNTKFEKVKQKEKDQEKEKQKQKQKEKEKEKQKQKIKQKQKQNQKERESGWFELVIKNLVNNTQKIKLFKASSEVEFEKIHLTYGMFEKYYRFQLKENLFLNKFSKSLGEMLPVSKEINCLTFRSLNDKKANFKFKIFEHQKKKYIKSKFSINEKGFSIFLINSNIENKKKNHRQNKKEIETNFGREKDSKKIEKVKETEKYLNKPLLNFFWDQISITIQINQTKNNNFINLEIYNGANQKHLLIFKCENFALAKLFQKTLLRFNSNEFLEIISRDNNNDEDNNKNSSSSINNINNNNNVNINNNTNNNNHRNYNINQSNGLMLNKSLKNNFSRYEIAIENNNHAKTNVMNSYSNSMIESTFDNKGKGIILQNYTDFANNFQTLGLSGYVELKSPEVTNLVEIIESQLEECDKEDLSIWVVYMDYENYYFSKISSNLNKKINKNKKKNKIKLLQKDDNCDDEGGDKGNKEENGDNGQNEVDDKNDEEFFDKKKKMKKIKIMITFSKMNVMFRNIKNNKILLNEKYSNKQRIFIERSFENKILFINNNGKKFLFYSETLIEKFLLVNTLLYLKNKFLKNSNSRSVLNISNNNKPNNMNQYLKKIRIQFLSALKSRKITINEKSNNSITNSIYEVKNVNHNEGKNKKNKKKKKKSIQKNNKFNNFNFNRKEFIYLVELYNSLWEYVTTANIILYQNYFELNYQNLKIYRYYSQYSHMIWDSKKKLFCKFYFDEFHFVNLQFKNTPIKKQFTKQFYQNCQQFSRSRIEKGSHFHAHICFGNNSTTACDIILESKYFKLQIKNKSHLCTYYPDSYIHFSTEEKELIKFELGNNLGSIYLKFDNYFESKDFETSFINYQERWISHSYGSPMDRFVGFIINKNNYNKNKDCILLITNQRLTIINDYTNNYKNKKCLKKSSERYRNLELNDNLVGSESGSGSGSDSGSGSGSESESDMVVEEKDNNIDDLLTNIKSLELTPIQYFNSEYCIVEKSKKNQCICFLIWNNSSKIKIKFPNEKDSLDFFNYWNLICKKKICS